MPKNDLSKEFDSRAELCREEFVSDVQLSQNRLGNYTIQLDVKKNLPTYGTISFIEPCLTQYNILKKFVGDYGFVVPVLGGKQRKVLRGEKKLKYKSSG